MKKIALALVLLVVAAGAGALLYVRASRPYRGYEGAEQFVEIPSGSGQPGDWRTPRRGRRHPRSC